MGRAQYSDDMDNDWELIKWRGQVASAIRGKRGQAFLQELLDALDAMPEKKLISGDLIRGGEVCAIGSLGLKRGIDLTELDPEDYDSVASAFEVTHQLVREVEYMNDEMHYSDEAERWQRMRKWVAAQIIAKPSTSNT